MRKAEVLFKGNVAGIISESENGYSFQYDSLYLENANAKAVSLTLPIQEKPHISKILFPFFDGLIPEGQLLDIASKMRNAHQHDRFGLLLALCNGDCIGCVSVHAIKQ